MILEQTFRQQLVITLLDKGLMAAMLAGIGFWVNSRLEASKTTTRLAEADAKLRNAKNPHVQFDLACNFFLTEQGDYIAEFCLKVENKHFVPLWIALMELDVRGISSSDELTIWTGQGTDLQFSERDAVVNFPKRVLKTKLVPLPNRVGWYSVDAGVSQTFTHIGLVDRNIKFIRVAALLARDEKGEQWHTAQRVFQVHGTSTPILATLKSS